MFRSIIAWFQVGTLFFKELALSVWSVARWVCRKDLTFQSAILAVPLDVTSPRDITLFANMITLTPGTTTLHISEDRKTLYAHVMDADLDPVTGSVAGMKGSFEKALLKVNEASR
jgi:multicomponent Na+:H+ antiporter subunit E